MNGLTEIWGNDTPLGRFLTQQCELFTEELALNTTFDALAGRVHTLLDSRAAAPSELAQQVAEQLQRTEAFEETIMDQLEDFASCVTEENSSGIGAQLVLRIDMAKKAHEQVKTLRKIERALPRLGPKI
ncbi:MAG: hypothetical protein SP1CHLAM54_00310 [Chlamydiia bacterium]|nr:hypothetical protein [Chlamydiia bacterium]